MTQRVQINRSVYTLEGYNRKYEPTITNSTSFAQSVRQKCTLRRVGKLMSSYLPIVKVVRKYRPREYLVGDILAGLTVSFIHLPQGLAFGLLASLPPIYGLYTSFFPVLFYMIFGTSPYVSYGSTANMAILTRTVIEREANSFIESFQAVANSSTNVSNTLPSDVEIFNVKVGAAMSCSLLSGLFLFVLGFFKLGFLTSYLSSSFIGGFTTAAGVIVASSQVPKLFGIKGKSFSGAGGLLLSYIDLFRNLSETMLAEVIISIICIATLLVVKICINEKFKERMKMSVPIDFILPVIATLVSFYAKLEDSFNVVIVGQIPTGFATPSLPSISNFSTIWSDSLVIAIVSLMMTITFAKLTANKHGNKIDESQEFLSYGASNILSGFFGCFPAANAASRSMILSCLGAKTTLNGLNSVAVLLITILVAGQLFVHLPTAVLASMIIVSTKNLIMQYGNLPNIWRINKYDFVIWTVTNITSVFLDLYYGLICGLAISFLLVVIQNQMQSGYLVEVATTENILYKVEIETRRNADTSIKIFRFPMNLYFATAERFKEKMHKVVFNPRLYVKRQKKLQKTIHICTNGTTNQAFGTLDDSKHTTANGTSEVQTQDIYKPEFVIIDCSRMSYIDMAGVNMLQEITQDFSKFDIIIYLTGISKPSMKTLTTAGFFKKFSRSCIYFDVFDALEVAKGQCLSVSYL